MSKHFQETDGGRIYLIHNPRTVELRKGDRVALQGTITGFGLTCIEVTLDSGQAVFAQARHVVGGRTVRNVMLPEHEPVAPALIDDPEMEGV